MRMDISAGRPSRVQAVSKAWWMARALGPFRRLRARIVRARERRTGVETSGEVGLEDLCIAGEGRVSYTPSAPRRIRRALALTEVTPDDVFADFGSGKGRVLLEAARLPFRRVIGVELSETLNAIARANLDAARPRLACRDVEIVTADLSEWPVPDDLPVAYFYNPLTGEGFRRALENLLASADRRPRNLRIVYVNPAEHDLLMSTGRVRLVKRERGLRPGRDWSQMTSLHVYEVIPREGA